MTICHFGMNRYFKKIAILIENLFEMFNENIYIWNKFKPL